MSGIHSFPPILYLPHCFHFPVYIYLHKDWELENNTNLNSIFCLIKSSEIVFIFFPAFYLIIWLMASPKNFEKIAIFKIWQLVFFWGVKIYFGELLLKWCIFSHGKNWFSQIMPFKSYYFHLMSIKPAIVNSRQSTIEY